MAAAPPPPARRSSSADEDDDDDDNKFPDMSLEDITTGLNDRGIPTVLFIEDITAYAAAKGANAELLLGAYSQLHQKYKTSEMRLQQKSEFLFVGTSIVCSCFIC